MEQQIDLRKGWCCDGRTWSEHAEEDGGCCQPEGMQIEDLSEDGQRAANERLGKAEGS